MADPAKTPKMPDLERRKKLQEECRKAPCFNLQHGWPPCVICVHEAEWIKRTKEKAT